MVIKDETLASFIKQGVCHTMALPFTENVS
jgi:hypothetical protein